MVQDLCDSLCSGLERSDWPLPHGPCTLVEDDVLATLCCPEMGRCTNEIKSWVEAGRWTVLREMWGKATRVPVWEVGWCGVAGLLEGSSPALLRPVALGTRCKAKVAKSVVADCDVSQLLPPIPFDLFYALAAGPERMPGAAGPARVSVPQRLRG